MDTAGEDDYQEMLDEWIKVGDGFLYVYSIDDHEGFDRFKVIYQRIEKKNKNNYPIILVGNIKELSEKDRKVSKTEAEEMAKSFGIEYIELSSVTDFNGNCNTVFQMITSKIIKFKEKQKGKKCCII